MYAVAYRNTMANARVKTKSDDGVVVFDMLEAKRRRAEQAARERLELKRARDTKLFEEKKAAAELIARGRQAAYAFQATEAALDAYAEIPVEGQWQDVRAMIENIAAKHGVTFADIVGVRVLDRVTRARHEAIRAIADAYPMFGLSQIGRIFRRDHSSISYALKKTKQPGAAR